MRAIVASAITRLIVRYAAGDVIAEANVPVSADELVLLRREHDEYLRQRDARQRLARTLSMLGLFAAMFALSGFYIHLHHRPLLDDISDVLTLVGLSLVTIVICMLAPSSGTIAPTMAAPKVDGRRKRKQSPEEAQLKRRRDAAFAKWSVGGDHRVAHFRAGSAVVSVPRRALLVRDARLCDQRAALRARSGRDLLDRARAGAAVARTIRRDRADRANRPGRGQ
jgi:hypothetical protein